jgi:hypothetical protein
MTTPDTLPVGWVQRRGDWQQLALPLSTLLKHTLTSGPTGSGKSGFLISLMLGVLTRCPHIGIVLIDAKGETAAELRENFLPALDKVHPRICADHSVVITPFGQYGVPLNPLRPMHGVATEIQANIVTHLVSGLVEGGLGQRGKGILAWLAQAAIATGGTLLDCLAMLQDEQVRQRVAQRVAADDLRTYLIQSFGEEPRASIDSLRARLEWLLLLPAVRGMLCADDCVSGAAVLEAPLTIIDLGGAPQGMVPLSRFVGSLLFSLVTGAIFSRAVTPSTHPVLVVVDEWQELAKVAVDDFERLLALARYKRIGLWLANQTLAQVSQASSALVQSLATNIALHIAFRPADVSELKHLLPLLPVTGRRIDSQLPDRLLTPEAERKALVEQLAKLPPRHALLGNLISGQAEVIRTLSVPYEEARRRSTALPPDVREAWARGRFGVPMTDLVRTAKSQVRSEPPDETTTVSPASSTAARSARRRTRAPLELP